RRLPGADVPRRRAAVRDPVPPRAGRPLDHRARPRLPRPRLFLARRDGGRLRRTARPGRRPPAASAACLRGPVRALRRPGRPARAWRLPRPRPARRARSAARPRVPSERAPIHTRAGPSTSDRRRRARPRAALAVGGCTAGVIGALRGGGEEQALTESAPFEADDAARTTPSTPADAAVLANLPEGAELMHGEVMGIDVSSHQREVDWPQVSADGVGFAYLKATEGAGFTDSHFRRNWDGARAAGI